MFREAPFYLASLGFIDVRLFTIMQIRVFDATAASSFRTVRESYELNPLASSTSRRSVAESTNLYRSSPSIYPSSSPVRPSCRNATQERLVILVVVAKFCASDNLLRERAFLTYSRLRRARPLRVMNIKCVVGESLLAISQIREFVAISAQQENLMMNRFDNG